MIFLVKDNNPFKFKEISEREGRFFCYPGLLCQELMLNRELLAKQKRFDHGLLRLPLEIILHHLLPYCIGEYIRVVFMSSQYVKAGEKPSCEDKTMIFVYTSAIKEVCQYIARRTFVAPHSLNLAFVKGDTAIYFSPYKKDITLPKRSLIFIWNTHVFPIEGCECPLKGTTRCQCLIDKYDWEPWITKYKWF